MSKKETEPSASTFEQVGRLCAAWSYLETVTEQTVWGIIGIDSKVGRFITWRLDLRGRWQLILDEATNKHTADDQKFLRNINKRVGIVTRDRNIIVHGVIRALVPLDPAAKQGEVAAKTGDPSLSFSLVPCWTVFRGAEAGKNFPISNNAVEMVLLNVQKTAKEIVDFNVRHKYSAINFPALTVEASWPKSLV